MIETSRPILFVSTPESGLLNPMLVLAGELARRGVPDLYFATDENRRADVEKLSDVSPVTFVSLGEVIPELSSVTWDDETYRAVTQRSRWKALRAVALHTFNPNLRLGKYELIDQAITEIKPALMIIESISMFAVPAAITRGVPFVLDVPFMPSNVLHASLPKNFPRPNSGLPLEMTFRQRVANRAFQWRLIALMLRPQMIKKLSAYKKARVRLGISPKAFSLSARTEEAELILCNSVDGLDFPLPMPDKLEMVGAIVPPLPEAEHDAGISDWLDAHESIVYMGFGTVTRLSQAEVASLVEVVRRLDGQHHVLWKLPEDQQRMLPPADQLPPNLRVESWLPSQFDVLAHPHVTLFVNHGGGNAFHEGLYFGKPMVIRPLWVDCYDQAVRGEWSGVSRTVDHPETIDADDLVDKITQVLAEPRFAARARHFEQLQRQAGGRTRAANLVLGLPALQQSPAGADVP